MAASISNAWIRLVGGLSLMLLVSCSTAQSVPANNGESAKADVDQLLAKAYLQIESSDYKGAEASLLQAQQKDKDNLWVIHNLGVVYQRTGRNDLALEEYNKVLAAEQASVKSGNAPKYAYWRDRLSDVSAANKKLLLKNGSGAEQPTQKPERAVMLDIKQQILVVLGTWKKTLEDKSFSSYLSLYGEDAQGAAKQAWEKDGSHGLLGKELKLIGRPVVMVESPDNVKVSLKLQNKDDGYLRKELVFVNNKGRWVIKEEY